MELRQLRYFVTVVDEGSFTRAAERLFVAQPGVSAQIRRLEAELGQTLLDRSGPSVRPTSAGTALLAHARDALAAVQHGRDSVDAVAGLAQGTITLGTVPNLASEAFDLPAALAEFHQEYPGIDISLTEGTAADLATAVREARLDAALLSLGSEPYEGLEQHTLARSPLVAAGHADRWTPPNRPIRLGELAEHTLMTMPKHTGIRSVLDAAFQRIGATPRVAIESGDPALLARLAHAGLGVAILPRPYAQGLPFVELDPPLAGQIALAWHRPHSMSPAAEALVRQLVQAGTVESEGTPAGSTIG